jgi:tetratricopeptide (TPR) repeat protein
MLPIRSSLCLLLAVFPAVAVLSLSADDRPSEPEKLPPYKRLLQGDDAKKAEQLEGEMYRRWVGGEFEDARKAAEELAGLRARRQGRDHWEAVNARWQVKLFQVVLKQDAESQAEVAGLLPLWNEAEKLENKGLYREAKPLREKILAVYSKVLSGEHPDTAQSYHNLAHNLNAQGHYAAAAPLYQKALDIYRKVLGEEHPDTARSYNNLAFNL